MGELEEKYRYIYMNLEDLKYGVKIDIIKKHDLHSFVQRIRRKVDGEAVSLYRLTDEYSSYFSRTNPFNNEDRESEELESYSDSSSEDSYIEELESKIYGLNLTLNSNEIISTARVEHKESRLEFMINHSNKYAYRVSSKFDRPVRLIYDPKRKNMFYRNKNAKITYLKQFFPEDLFWICTCPIHFPQVKSLSMSDCEIERFSSKRFKELTEIEENKDRLSTQETLHAINLEKFESEISLIEERITRELEMKRDELIHKLNEHKRSKRK